MSNRLYTGAIVVFWLAAMGWLVTDRILPPFVGGGAPPVRLSRQVDPVAWAVEMDGVRCGVAVLQARENDYGGREVHSCVKFDRISAPKAVPLWLKPMLKPLRNVSFEMRTTTFFDSLERLNSFRTVIDVSEVEVPIRLSGRIAGERLKLRVRIGEISKDFEHTWPGEAMLSGDLNPAPRLLPLYDGRTWRQETYSPLASPKEPFEILEARVTGRVRIDHPGGPVDGWEVEYRSLEKTGLTEQGRIRAKLHVATDGEVLRQQAFLFGSSVSFVRESEEESRTLAGALLPLERQDKIETRASPSSPVGEASSSDG